MTQIGILCAMEKEKEFLIRHIYNKTLGENVFTGTTKPNGGKSVMVCKSGIGKVNAAVKAQMMINRGVQNIISIGVAGAVDESLNVGDIVIGNSYCYHDVWCGEPNSNGQVQGFPSVFPSSFVKWMDGVSMKKNIHLGTIATGDWFVQKKEEIEAIKKFLPKEYNVVAVDMESAAIAQVCYNENIPFMSIRVISDNPLRGNQQEQYLGFWDSLAEKSFDFLYNIIA